MFDPDFFTNDQYQQITAEFYQHAKKKRRPVLDQESMKIAIRNLKLIPTPTEKELSAMCRSSHADLEEFFITIFWYLRGFGTRNEMITSFSALDPKKRGLLPFSKLSKALRENPYRFNDNQLNDIRGLLKIRSDDDEVDYVAFAHQIRAK